MSFSTDHPVRTRFAPSPKGFLHIGWYRLLIFSWLVAKHQGGQFLLRVEDTDQQRIVPGVIEDLMESLHWLGIDFDEGPGIGGSFGPITSLNVSRFMPNLLCNYLLADMLIAVFAQKSGSIYYMLNRWSSICQPLDMIDDAVNLPPTKSNPD